MEKAILKAILLDQNKIKEENLVKRDIFNEIEKDKKNPFIIIISGVRRCGKSTLLNQIRTNQCYYINFDDERLINFKVSDFQTMYEILIELFGEKEIFLFDEIQNIDGWERFVRRLHNNKKKIYVTGSNASMLSRELGTHLTGRHIAYELYPFSFREFLRFKNHPLGSIEKLNSIEKSKLKKLFNEYLNEGGFPEYLQTKKREYLKTVYENILYRDIITRYHLSSQKPLKETVYFVASNIGKELSFNAIKKITGLTSATTIKEYFEYLRNSYLVFLVSKYDPSLKKQAYASKKSYLIDVGMAKEVGFRTSEDEGRLIENVAFLHLKRNNKEVFFHKQKRECDFILRKGLKIKEAIQVTSHLDSKNEKREIEGLLEALNRHNLKEGLILTLDDEKEINIDNKKIMIKPLWKWLLEYN
ncbi:MAG: ATP-binding protein [Nanoarchaeota archaeon]|nr:ATP-binding protein [Nanoarchaeota archaeon]